MELALALFVGLVGAIVGGLIGLLLALSIGGVTRDDITVRTVPNEEIRRSLRVASIPVLGALLLGSTTFLVSPKHSWSILGLVSLLAVFGGLRLGGLAVIQHYMLRLILWAKRDAPLNYIRFLNHATDLVSLRRIGSGYIFIHRMLLDHFAALTTEPEHDVQQAN